MKICEHKLTKLIGEHTIVEWFEWAKDNGFEWAQSALDQYDPSFNGEYGDGSDPCSLSDALLSAFDWDSSPEGYTYWDKIQRFC